MERDARILWAAWKQHDGRFNCRHGKIRLHLKISVGICSADHGEALWLFPTLWTIPANLHQHDLTQYFPDGTIWSWLVYDGMSTIFPEAWESFAEGKDQKNHLKSYYEDLTSQDDPASRSVPLCNGMPMNQPALSFFSAKETLVSDEQRYYARHGKNRSVIFYRSFHLKTVCSKYP